MAGKIEKETDMYLPIKNKLERLGYTVRSEIKNCDIMAVNDSDDIIIVEMKRSFNITVVYQAMDRRSITPNVYIAIPRPSSFREKNTRMMLRLVNELGIGLITVSNDRSRNVDFWAEPQRTKKVNSRRKDYVKKEFNQRSDDRNTGGSTQKKLVTAYTEASVLALCHMEAFDFLKTRDIKKLGYMDKVRNALKSNAYGWFEKGGRGVYGMSVKGVDALEDENIKDLVEFYRKEVQKNVQDRQE